MTIEQIKEQLSNRYIGVLAANKGYLIEKGETDPGVDYTLKKPYTYTLPNGSTRRTTDGKYIDIQLKATTENQIVDEPDNIKYDLEVKNYNDMIHRGPNPNTPLILILFVLPNDRDHWVDIDITELRLRRRAYWYQPPAGAGETNNLNTIRIIIPKTNILGIDCFDTLHTQFYP